MGGTRRGMLTTSLPVADERWLSYDGRHAMNVRGPSMSVAASGMTVNELKQQLSIAYVHAVAARAGYTCQLKNVDNDSIDVQVAAGAWFTSGPSRVRP